jgi:hypothetical protein
MLATLTSPTTTTWVDFVSGEGVVADLSDLLGLATRIGGLGGLRFGGVVVGRQAECCDAKLIGIRGFPVANANDLDAVGDGLCTGGRVRGDFGAGGGLGGSLDRGKGGLSVELEALPDEARAIVGRGIAGLGLGIAGLGVGLDGLVRLIALVGLEGAFDGRVGLRSRLVVGLGDLGDLCDVGCLGLRGLGRLGDDVGPVGHLLERRGLGQALGHRREVGRVVLCEEAREERGHLLFEGGDAGLNLCDFALDHPAVTVDLTFEL